MFQGNIDFNTGGLQNLDLNLRNSFWTFNTEDAVIDTIRLGCFE